jgi:two-component sensor histidine kinase
MKKRSVFAPVSRIVLPYLVLGALWILFSDRLLTILVNDPPKLLFVSLIKGWFYVLVTALLLLWLVYRELRQQANLETMLRKGLAEKDALLAELNHRVMNNLQILTSILNLESENLEGPEASELNTRSRARIRSMGIAQERLYDAGDFGRIDLGSYLRALWEADKEVFSTKDPVASFDLIEVHGGPSEAMPFGLFATEAISNALRYGAGSDGHINVAIRLAEASGGLLEFSIRDCGPGLPEGASGLGLRLMDALGAQLRGTVARRNDGGALVVLRFPRPGGPDA